MSQVSVKWVDPHILRDKRNTIAIVPVVPLSELREVVERLKRNAEDEPEQNGYLSAIIDLQARLTASEARIRACTQTIIAEIGSNGPENLEESIGRLITKLATLSLSQRKRR